MQILDYHFSNNNYWNVKDGMGMLEKLAHDAHMHEIYSQLKPLYRKIEFNPPDAATCKCATDEINNGILDALKYPNLCSNVHIDFLHIIIYILNNVRIILKLKNI